MIASDNKTLLKIQGLDDQIGTPVPALLTKYPADRVCPLNQKQKTWFHSFPKLTLQCVTYHLDRTTQTRRSKHIICRKEHMP